MHTRKENCLKVNMKKRDEMREVQREKVHVGRV